MMFMPCMCLFSLSLVPVPADVPSGTSPSQRGMCNATSAGSQLSLQVTRCQLKKRCLYKAPPPPRSANRALFVKRQRRASPHVVPLLPQDIYSLNIKIIYTRNIWRLMLYSAFHMLDVNVNYLGNVEWFLSCALNCSICTMVFQIRSV